MSVREYGHFRLLHVRVSPYKSAHGCTSVKDAEMNSFVNYSLMLRRIDVFIALTFMSGFKCCRIVWALAPITMTLAKADGASFYLSTTFHQKDGGQERSWLSEKL
jgi:hypothetical protein